MWRQPQTPRYDKIAPQEFAEFFFEPQDRDLVYANYIVNPAKGSIDTFRATASYHRQKEGRNEVKRGETARRQRYDTVNTIGLSTQAVSSILPKQRLVGGAEFYFDTIQSRTVKTDGGKEDIDEDKGRFINGSQFGMRVCIFKMRFGFMSGWNSRSAAARRFIKPMQTSPSEIRLLMNSMYSTAV